MAERFIRASHLRSLLPAVLLLAPALAVATILVGAFTGAERPTGADGVAPAEAARTATRPAAAARRRSRSAGLATSRPDRSTACRPNGGAPCSRTSRPRLRAPDLMAGNLEGTLSTGGASKCGARRGELLRLPGAAGERRRAGRGGPRRRQPREQPCLRLRRGRRSQTLGALTRRRSRFTGLPGEVRVLAAPGVRVAFVGFSTYRWTPSMDDAPAVRALVDQARGARRRRRRVLPRGRRGLRPHACPLGREWAFGEDRGDSRAFAHLAIDAGADLVLGSGPHVIRGVRDLPRAADRLLAGQLRRRATTSPRAGRCRSRAC